MKKHYKWLVIIFIVILSLSLRIYAANNLQIDADESVYVNSGLEYAKYIRENEWKWLAWSNTNFEHPALNKIIYGFALLLEEPIDKLFDKDVQSYTPIQATEGRPWIMVGRYGSVIFGTLAIFVLSFINPLAGFLLGIDTLNIQYTSVMYIEALPLLTSLCSVVAYLKFITSFDQQKRPQYFYWLILSAIFLGMSAASKYIYSIVSFPILFHFILWMIKKKYRTKVITYIFAWGMLSIVVFTVCNPYLWLHPIERLTESLLFHVSYSSSVSVTQFDFPFWQPLKWFTAPIASLYPSTPSAFIFKCDLLITIFALLGLPKLFQKYRLYFMWLIIGIGILLIWPTKWPQYTQIIIVPYCLSAAMGISTLINLGKNLFLRYNRSIHKTRGAS